LTSAASFVQHTSGCCIGSQSSLEPPLPVYGTVKLLPYQIEKNEMGGACSTYGGRRGAYRVLVGKPEGNGPLGRPRRWDDNVKMDLQNVGWGLGLD